MRISREPAVERHRLCERDGGRRRLHGFGALEMVALHVELRLDRGALLFVGGRRKTALETLDRIRHAADEELVRTRVLRFAREDLCPRELVSDDLDVRPVDLIAV